MDWLIEDRTWLKDVKNSETKPKINGTNAVAVKYICWYEHKIVCSKIETWLSNLEIIRSYPFKRSNVYASIFRTILVCTYYYFNRLNIMHNFFYLNIHLSSSKNANPTSISWCRSRTSSICVRKLMDVRMHFEGWWSFKTFWGMQMKLPVSHTS